ncbi:tRNA (adenosine(37)-N6)-threonylcarbamoyltransferase complex ATPase subunit type 1 TsaE [Desulfolucanica intricata]|uniref:tRNA (adenosine(37)-N6)-threonylcarbamoyltransferase complex ATPase subunit type 1 TsaE n=1 Tax=Desulfolucanica intricata TaxID=1285191 RepID=UPI00082FC9D0|nr:tRNA (adenosine(37)-N6)-threonylcarbamoyltransferase complex ATPase subunit type 1 TsaE [Desulfolucanica intricata]
MLIINTSSPDETEAVGAGLGSIVSPGDILCLNGDLGAGKTCFARGVARGLDIKEPVTSPTFTLINEYQGRIPFYHFDVYRLGGPEEMDDLGYEEYFYNGGVTLLEWAELVLDVLPGERLDIFLETAPENPDRRKIVLLPYGEHYVHLAEELMNRVCPGN